MNQAKNDAGVRINKYEFAELLKGGYTEELKKYTKKAANNPELVNLIQVAFEIVVGEDLVVYDETESQQDVFMRVENSISEMFQLGLPNEYKNFMVFTNHGVDNTIEIGWNDGRAGPVVWDRWTYSSDDPVMDYAILGCLNDQMEYRCAPKPSDKPDPPLYRFHPERFKAFRSYAESVGKIYRQKVDPVSGMLDLELLNQVMGLVMTDMNQRAMVYPRRWKESHPSPSLVIESEETLSTAYGRFVQAGRQIVDFPPALTEMLGKTDVDDIPLDSIKFPYASQYLYFGPQQEMEIETGWLVDGAYVEQRGAKGDIRFTVTAVPSDHSLSRQWYLFPEVEYTQDFVGDFRSMDLATAMDTVLSDRLANLREHQGKVGGDITDAVEDEFAKIGESMPEGMQIIDKGPEMAAYRESLTRRRHPIYRDALQLVVNALCYIAAYPDDIDTVWPEGTPESLKEKVLHGKGKEQMRAKSKLASLGYVPVHICGKRIEEQRSTHGITSPGNGHVATHWRRGHWRNQVHGPGRSLRKFIWVMPVLVGSKASTDEPEMGHVYLVS